MRILSLRKVLGVFEKLDTSQSHYDEINRLATSAMAGLQIDNKVDELRTLYKQLESQLKNPINLKNADLFHSLLLSELFYKRGRVDSSLFYAERAMSLDTIDLYAPELLIQALFKSWELNAFENPADTIDSYYYKYGAFRENQVFVNNLMRVVLVNAHDEILNKKYKKSSALILRFEELSDRHPDVKVDASIIATVYSRIAIYEYNRNKNKALKTIARGLKYAPGARDLVNMKAMMLN